MQPWSEVQGKTKQDVTLCANLHRERQQQSQALFREPVWLSRKRFCLPGHYRVDTRHVETNVAKMAVMQAPPLNLFCKGAYHIFLGIARTLLAYSDSV